MRNLYLIAAIGMAMLAAGCDKDSIGGKDAGNEIHLETRFAFGGYYGQPVENANEYNYTIWLYEYGKHYEDGSIDYDGDYYCLDFYSAEAPADMEDIQLPAGTYLLGEPNILSAGTLAYDYSAYCEVWTNDDHEYCFTSGEVSVSYSGDDIIISGVLTDEAGRTHYVSYVGPCIIPNYTEPEEDIIYEYDTLYCCGIYYGLKYSEDSEYWYKLILSDIDDTPEGTWIVGGRYYIFYVFTADPPSDMNDIRLPAGTYSLGEEGAYDPGTLYRDMSSYQLCNYYNDGAVSSSVDYFTAGAIEISYSGDNMVLTGILRDDDGGTHYLNFSWQHHFIDDSI